MTYDSNYLSGDGKHVPLSLFKKGAIVVGRSDGEPRTLLVTADDAGKALVVTEDGDLAFAEVESEGGDVTPYDQFASFLGDGSNGALVVANGQTVSLVQDKSYTTVVVQSGGVLDTGFRRVYATTSITVEAGGVIRSAVPAPVSPGFTLAGTGVIGAGNSTGSVKAGGSGGTTTTGNPGSPSDLGYGGAGGTGGAIGGTAGGAGGGVTNEDTYIQSTIAAGSLWPSPIRVSPWRRMDLALGAFGRSGGVILWAGGGGGGGGASVDGSHRGGAGGTGGGVVFLAAPLVTINGTVESKGSPGAASNSSSNGGGGGGGGGGLIVINTKAAVAGTPTYDVSGGAGGAAVGTGSVGAAGSTGTTIVNIWP